MLSWLRILVPLLLVSGLALFLRMAVRLALPIVVVLALTFLVANAGPIVAGLRLALRA